jgi:arsenite-transporting ATPase
MYKIDKLPPDIEEYIDSAAAEPAMYESAVYDAMVDVVARGNTIITSSICPPSATA